MSTPDPSPPVVIGAGQASDHLDSPDYHAWSAADLAAAAAGAALADAGIDASAVTTVATTRQFDDATPMSHAPLGRPDNFPRAVAQRIGAKPDRAIVTVTGGQSPQQLVNDLCADIAGGRQDVSLALGAEAISTVAHLSGSDDAPSFHEDVGGQLEDRGYGLTGLVTMQEVRHGLLDAPAQYALLEQARRSRTGLSSAAYAAEMGRLFAPFTAVAASNPHAAARTVRTPEELVAVSHDNRLIAEPYTRYVVARDKVNQAAAVVVTSVGTARELGVPEDRWVFLQGRADTVQRRPLQRPDMGAFPAAGAAVRTALDMAGTSLDGLDAMDLYSCFPIAVFAVCDALGLDPEDPRGLTITGGLPFFGGPGNNYSMHAIADMVQRVREEPGSRGLVGANGGVLSKYSVGVYGTTPTPWRASRDAETQAELDAVPPHPVTRRPDGWATVESYTIVHRRDGHRRAVVVGRLEEGGARFMATSEDEDVLAALRGHEPFGTRLLARTFGFGNRVTTSPRRMAERFPPVALGLRESYDHLLVRREGRRLEITINRPEARNALHTAAHRELEQVFDTFFADPELWVAILTGAGDRAFSAGNDLKASASGRVWIPHSGFAGLTLRRDMPKPVIAAVNGYALGGGLETALACHVVVADESAEFGLPEVRVGLIAGAGGLVRLPRAVPPHLAQDMILTGRRTSAEEMARHGVVSRIAPAGGALAVAREVAEEIIAASPTAVRLSLRAMQAAAAIPNPVDAIAQTSDDAIDELMASADMFEGMAAFAEKRPPRWTGR